MKTNSTQQEILLITGTSFSSREWIKKDSTAQNRSLTEKEHLEEACWDGLLQEMLPEICIGDQSGRKIYLWQIKEAEHFLELELSELPEMVDSYFSIDPYLFARTKLAN